MSPSTKNYAMIGKYLDPNNDYAFRELFVTEKNKDIFLVLLNKVLKNKIKGSKKEIQFLSFIRESEALSQRQGVVDVFCADSQGGTIYHRNASS